MSVRLRRLKADYDKMCAFFSAKTRIHVLKTLGNPPEKYQVELLVTSLQKDLVTQQLKQHNAFLAEIVLTASYPRLAPQCRMLTPVFHPNIAPHAICIGDYWAAGESLPNLVVRIAEMLAYQSYNLKSPLNGEAAKWAAQHEDDLPLDRADFAALLSTGEAVSVDQDGAARPSGACGNCGKSADQAELHVCANRHVACSECLLECPVCHRTLCLKCERLKCAICGEATCQKCVLRCSACGQLACLPHIGQCSVCGQSYCGDCLALCEKCGAAVCVAHVVKTEAGGTKRYLCGKCAAQGT